MTKTQSRNKMTFLIAGISLIILAAGHAGAVNTQIQTDHTLSGITALNVDTPGTGQVYTLSEIHGNTAGDNLFYSFSNFSIGETDAVSFNLNTADLANVISRVTGGSESLIAGTLKMMNTGSTPAFFLINPAGITFSSGASVDVPGAFYVSTASKLYLDDGSQYAANETAISSLSTANPESFGFLGDESGSINIGSLETAPTTLFFRPGTDVGFVANQIQINNSTVTNTDILKTGLDMQLIATSDESIQVPTTQSGLTNQPPAGNVVIKNTMIETSGDGGGHLTVQSGNLTIDNSILYADNMGNQPITDLDGIDISARSHLRIENNSLITSNAYGEADAGNLDIIAKTVNLKNVAGLNSSTYNKGDAGNVTIDASSVVINKNAGIYVDAYSLNPSINENTDKTRDVSLGSVGSVTIKADTLQLDSGTITTESYDTNIGNSSSDNFKAIWLSVDKLELKNKSTISSSTFGAAEAGYVFIEARQVDIDASIISSSAEAGSTGSAGVITIVGSEDSFVSAESLNITNGGRISTSTEADVETKYVGEVCIWVQKLNVASGGQINTTTSGQADAGFIGIFANQIEIDGQDSIISSSAEDGSTGSAGFINIAGPGSTDKEVIPTDSIIITNGGKFNSSTLGQGNAGVIKINFQELLHLDSSVINTDSERGKGGNIVINGGDIIHLHNAKITTSVLGSSGKEGGNITIADVGLLVMNTGFIQANTEGDGKNAGIIHIDEMTTLIPSNETLITHKNSPEIKRFKKDGGINVIQSEARKGSGGSVEFSPPQLNLSGILTNLTIASFDSNDLNRNMCTVDEGSSLFQSGKGGMRMRARDFLLAPVF